MTNDGCAERNVIQNNQLVCDQLRSDVDDGNKPQVTVLKKWYFEHS